jgi:TetR/AcrR family transcriptional regulator, regulator of cefoperazone and chloramphenicol sensitivity
LISARSQCRPRLRGHRRGDDTRRRIVAAAIDMFALHGYDGTSTRALAESAEVNLPAIQYHFGSKEGLYRAAVDHIVDQIVGGMKPTVTRVAAALAGGELARNTLFALLFDMLDALLAIITEDPRAPRKKLFIARADIERSAALKPLHATMQQYTLGPCLALVARLTDRPHDDDRTIAQTLLIIGQVMVFAHRGPQCGLGWDRVDEVRLQIIRALLHEHTRAILAAAGATQR